MNKNLICPLALFLLLSGCSRKNNGQIPPLSQQPLSAATEETLIHPEEVKLVSFLNRFHDNPGLVMDESPEKIHHPNAAGPLLDESHDEESTDLNLELKNKLREKVISASLVRTVNRAAAGPQDQVEQLVENPAALITTLGKMDQMGLTKAALPHQPWSDDYWAIKKGILGHRYADPQTPKEGSWKDFSDFSTQKSINQYIQSGTTKLLSPSEKYDLLVGDTKTSLTAYSWNQGRQYYEKDGKVEDWMGICHGWAPAAYRLDRPLKKITVKSVQGTPIEFYPADIKALGSLLWAQANYSTRFVGGRCDVKDPKKDNAGRIIEAKCFDTNPATWHKAIVNLVGVQKKSFVMDATYDYEVWNQPVLSYSYLYFNPQTSKTASSAQSVTIPIQSYSKDKFTSYRSPQTHSVVGVQMKVDYMVETTPVHRDQDAPKFDAVTSVTYTYDLELDQQGKIIGGEWYSNKHPDFLWTPEESDKALSAYEGQVQGSWNSQKDNLPSDWGKIAAKSSGNGQPLAKIVENLIQLSAQGNSPTPDPDPIPDPNPNPDPTPDPDPVPNPDPTPDPTPNPTPDPGTSADQVVVKQLSRDLLQANKRLLESVSREWEGRPNWMPPQAVSLVESLKVLVEQSQNLNHLLSSRDARSQEVKLAFFDIAKEYRKAISLVGRIRLSPQAALDLTKLTNAFFRLNSRIYQ